LTCFVNKLKLYYDRQAERSPLEMFPRELRLASRGYEQERKVGVLLLAFQWGRDTQTSSPGLAFFDFALVETRLLDERHRRIEWMQKTQP